MKLNKKDFFMIGTLSVVGALAFHACKKLSGRKMKNDEHNEELYIKTMELRKNHTQEEVKEYIEYLNDAKVSGVDLCIAKQAYDYIKDLEGIDDETLSDFQLLLELKGYKWCFKYIEE